MKDRVLKIVQYLDDEGLDLELDTYGAICMNIDTDINIDRVESETNIWYQATSYIKIGNKGYTVILDNSVEKVICETPRDFHEYLLELENEVHSINTFIRIDSNDKASICHMNIVESELN